MIKLMTFEHLDNAKQIEVEFHLTEEGGHWVAQMKQRGPESGVKAPTFYGSTREQAERQLRKVFEKEYELASEEVLAAT